MPAGDVVEQLKTAKREVANRDTTLKALQRNYETLAQVHEESKAEHQRAERVESEMKRRWQPTWKDDDKGKGKAKGKQKGRGKGAQQT